MIDIHISTWKTPHKTFVRNKLLSSGLHQIVLGGSGHIGTVCSLGGGWTNPIEKYARQNGNLPQNFGVKVNDNYLKTLPRYASSKILAGQEQP